MIRRPYIEVAMQQPNPDNRISRRSIVRFGAAGMFLAVLNRTAHGEAWERLEAVRKLLGDRKPASEGLTLELPLVSEDGSSVPLTVRADGPMTAAEHVQSIHLFATRNPNPEIAEFRFTPLCGRAQVATRVRLSESQTVVAVARTSRDRLYAVAREIRITTSGCLVRADSQTDSNEMAVRVRVPERFRPGEAGEILTLINHPMETGLREDRAGKLVPQRIIRAFSSELAGERVFEATLYRAIAANPYLRFYVAPKAGGDLVLRWTEDTGRIATYRVRLAVA
jgi:sulfur-oxidizing protein SoxY